MQLRAELVSKQLSPHSMVHVRTHIAGVGKLGIATGQYIKRLAELFFARFLRLSQNHAVDAMSVVRLRTRNFFFAHSLDFTGQTADLECTKVLCHQVVYHPFEELLGSLKALHSQVRNVVKRFTYEANLDAVWD